MHYYKSRKIGLLRACDGLFSEECVVDRLALLDSKIEENEDLQRAVTAIKGAIILSSSVRILAFKLNSV